VIAPTLVREISEILLTHDYSRSSRLLRGPNCAGEEVGNGPDIIGSMMCKVVKLFDGRSEKRPEFDDVQAIARRTGRPSREILQILDRELNQ
jgi:hypothetical protein